MPQTQPPPVRSMFDVVLYVLCVVEHTSGESSCVSALCCKGPSFSVGVGDERVAIGQDRYRNRYTPQLQRACIK